MSAIILVGLLSLVAVACLVLRLPAPAAAAGTAGGRRAQIEDSLAELARARAEGVIDAASFDDERQRLQAELSQLPADDDAVPARPARTWWPFALAVLVLLPLASGSLYLFLQGPFWQALDASRAGPAATSPVDPAAMVASLEARLAANGDDVEGWKRLGRSYVVLGRPDDARRAYDRAAALAPDDMAILEGYAAVAEDAPPPAIAAMIERLEQAALAAPQDPAAWVRAGFARAARGDRAGARDAYARAHELDPQRPEVLAAYAASAYALNPREPSDEAVAAYRKLIALQPDNASALWVLGQAAQLAGRPDEARDYWQRLLERLPEGEPLRAQVQRVLEGTAPPGGP
ncbi:c-type cytochrome biogenesis protein CcmI [Immundisolibacter sp.]|uniref:c-type cytochrome biogenesis protein CcmI n=1 Tax=Immundisolibacter sp. TaxID=1934948 RepID=UPI003F86F223